MLTEFADVDEFYPQKSNPVDKAGGTGMNRASWRPGGCLCGQL
jgi:hypothetical protein